MNNSAVLKLYRSQINVYGPEQLWSTPIEKRNIYCLAPSPQAAKNYLSTDDVCQILSDKTFVFSEGRMVNEINKHLKKAQNTFEPSVHINSFVQFYDGKVT